MNKKIISIVLSLVLVLQCISFTSYADTTVSSGFEFSELSNEYSLLEELNIVEKNSGNSLPKTVTRGEFTYLALKTLNVKVSSDKSASNTFIDVPPGHQYIDSISSIVKLGFMKGASGGTFRPDENITVEEVVCVVLRMINADKALGISGALSEYVSAASRHGILEGVGASDYSRRALRADVYIILYNALKTPVYIDETYSSEPTYFIDENRTVLTEFWNIKKAQGLVWADNITSINGERTDKENSLNIQGKIFLSDTDTTRNMVGKEIEFYYFDNKTAPVICMAEAPNSEVVELDRKNIVDFDYAGGKYVAEIEGKEKTFKIGDSYYLSYNGDGVFISNPDLMYPEYGSVTLISNGNGIYDVVIVNEYYNMVLDYYDPYQSKLVDIFDSNLNVCLNDYEIVGGIEDFSTLSRYDIITVRKTPSGKRLELILNTRKISGVVTEISSGSNEPYACIEDKVLEFKGDVRFNISDIELGIAHTFYLDYYGNPIYMTKGGKQSGIILAYSTPSGLSKRECLILTKSGALITFSLADGISVRDSSGVHKKSQEELTSYVPEHTTVLFDTNSDGKLNEIILPMIINTEDEYKNLPNYPLFKVDYFLRQWPVSAEDNNLYYEVLNGFADWLIMDKGTVMQIPLAPTTTYNNVNTDSFNITALRDEYEITVNTDPGSPRQAGEIEVYQTSTDFCSPSILVIHGGEMNNNSPLSTDLMPCVITGISKAYDKNNDRSSTKIEYMNNKGKIQSAFLSDESINTRSYLSSQGFGGTAMLHPSKQFLRVGDVIQLSGMDINGCINKLALLYDCENETLSYSAFADYGKIFRVRAVESLICEGTYYEYKNLSTNSVERTNIKNAAIIVLEADRYGNFTSKLGSRDDVMPGDKAVIYSRYANNRIIFVYKN